MDKPNRKTVIITALLLFSCSVIIHGIIIYNVFPPGGYLTKYQVAVQQYQGDKIPTERLLDYSLFYFNFNLAARKLTADPYRFLVGFQILLSALSTLLLFLILHRHFKYWPALIFTFLFIVNKSVILYTRTLEPEPLLIFFILGFLYFLPRSSRASVFAAGLFFSFGFITRLNFFPLVILVPLYFWLREKNLKKFIKPTALFLAPVLLFTIFLAVRNSRLAGNFTFFNMNPGQVFYEGNNPNSWGESASYPPLVPKIAALFPRQADFEHVVYRYFARKIHNRPMTVNEVNTYWSGKAKNFILDHPGYFFKRALTKLHFVFHNYRRHDLANVFRNDRRLDAFPTIPLGLITALALVGMILMVRHWKEHLLIYAALLSQVGTMTAIYMSDRQRVVIIPLFLFFAAGAVHYLWENRVKYKKILLPLLLIVILFPVLHIETPMMQDEHYCWAGNIQSQRHFRTAAALMKQGDIDRAFQQNILSAAAAPVFISHRRLRNLPEHLPTLEQAALQYISISPSLHPSARFDLGYLYLLNQKPVEARSIFKSLENVGYTFNRTFNQSSQPHYYIAKSYLFEKDWQNAMFHLEAALEKNPGDPWVLSGLFALSGKEIYRKSLFRYFDAIDARYFLGRAFLETGEPSKAMPHFLYVTQKVPMYAPARVYLNRCLLKFFPFCFIL